MFNPRLRIFTYVVLLYTLFAFVWWSVLLNTKNQDAFEAKSQLLQIGMAAEGLIQTPDDYYRSERYAELKQVYQRQEYMIMGEMVVLVLSLLGGMYIVYRGYQQEVKASQQQRNFLLSITHELKSPIASIRLILQTLQGRRDRLSGEQLHQLGQNGIKEADRLNKLVEDILLSARLETAYNFSYEPIDLSALVNTVASSVATHHPDADINIEVEAPNLMMKGDRQAMTSVIINLVENAIKYSGHPAQVDVHVCTRDDKKIALIVADQGMGIPPEERRLVFQKFYRIGSEDTRKTKGTGLGLFIVKEIVERHGGQIKVSANKPQGTVITITWPQWQQAKDIPEVLPETA